MTIGLILLAAVSVFLFFGGTDKFFAQLGLPGKAAFFVLLALVAGVAIPVISIGSEFKINLGGFLIPLAVMTVFLLRCAGGSERMKAVLSIASVAAADIAVRMLIPATSAGLIVTISVVTGFVGAVVACIISTDRIPALAGVLGGTVLADIVTSIVFRFFLDGSVVELGTAGVFDSVVIGIVFTVIIAEVLSLLKKRSKNDASYMLADTEAGEDVPIENMPAPSPPIFHFTEEDYEEYFNDDID